MLINWWNQATERIGKQMDATGMRYDDTPNGVTVTIDDATAFQNERNKEAVINFLSSIGKQNSNMQEARSIKSKIAILEKLTGHKIILIENSNGMQNLAVEQLKMVSETLDTLSQNLSMAIEKINEISGQGVTITKLQGLTSIIESAKVDVSEMITQVTGAQTKEDTLHEDEGDVNLSMGMDTAIKKTNDLKQMTDKGLKVEITDEDSI